MYGYFYDPYRYQYPNPYYAYGPMYRFTPEPEYWPDVPDASDRGETAYQAQGKQPFVINIHAAALENDAFRKVIWTGDRLQVTLMSLHPGEDIGLEIHPDTDQFLRIEQGQGRVQMGKTKEHLTVVRSLTDDSAIMVPAGTWHNVTNTGNVPMKLYSIYAPPHHPAGAVHQTKADAMAAE